MTGSADLPARVVQVLCRSSNVAENLNPACAPSFVHMSPDITCSTSSRNKEELLLSLPGDWRAGGGAAPVGQHQPMQIMHEGIGAPRLHCSAQLHLQPLQLLRCTNRTS